MRCNHSDKPKYQNTIERVNVSILSMRCNHSDSMCLKPLPWLVFDAAFRAPSFLDKKFTAFCWLASSCRSLSPYFMRVRCLRAIPRFFWHIKVLGKYLRILWQNSHPIMGVTKHGRTHQALCDVVSIPLRMQQKPRANSSNINHFEFSKSRKSL